MYCSHYLCFLCWSPWVHKLLWVTVTICIHQQVRSDFVGLPLLKYTFHFPQWKSLLSARAMLLHPCIGQFRTCTGTGTLFSFSWSVFHQNFAPIFLWELKVTRMGPCDIDFNVICLHCANSCALLSYQAQQKSALPPVKFTFEGFSSGRFDLTNKAVAEEY